MTSHQANFNVIFKKENLFNIIEYMEIFECQSLQLLICGIFHGNFSDTNQFKCQNLKQRKKMSLAYLLTLKKIFPLTQMKF